MSNITDSEKIIRSAVVTGASRGIGKAICLRLASLGYNICIGYAGNENGALDTLNKCLSANENIKVITYKADVSDENQVNDMMAAAVNAFGRIDVLVNSAGITKDDLLIRMTSEEFDSVIACNLRGTYLCCHAAASQMLRQKYGRIVNISSISGIHGNAGQVNYSASKAGVIGLTKSIAVELARKNITANAVAPGFIDTDMTSAMTQQARESAIASIPCRRAGTPEDVANAVSFLASDEAAYITGQTICVDGGMAL